MGHNEWAKVQYLPSTYHNRELIDAFSPDETEVEAHSQTLKVTPDKMVSVSLESAYFSI